jgi:peptidylprolyl isomerase
VASSRQRERELARRRYERRRLREQQLRARRRRRNTIIGAVAGTMAVLVGLVFAGLALAGSFSSSPAKVVAKNTASPSPSTNPSPPPAPPTKCAAIKPDPPGKGQPVIPQVTGKAPTKLVVKDVKTGTGKVAKAGSTLNVLYVGISCSTGKVFDASYLHGNSSFPVTLAPAGQQASVIQGWNTGLVGVHAGGVRELVIPPALGYGPQGQPPTIKGNEVLIFLVTVKSVK